jgi:putative endonuclease
MFWVYVIYSEQFDKIYIGYSSDPDKRLLSHNFLSKKGWTIRFRPWTKIYSEPYPTKEQAIRREKELKTAKGRKFIWQLIKNK